MVSGPTTAFERLANRPPTPPKGHDNGIDEALRFLDVDFTLQDTPATRVDTTIASSSPAPPSSPQSSSSSDKEGKDKCVKKVEFSPCVTAHKPNTFGPISKGSPLLKRVHQNKDLKPLKSILKSNLGQDTPLGTPESTASSAADYFSISDPATFPAMLESVVKLLASSSTALRQDGYRTINLALKAHEGLVDLGELKAKMTLFTQFMARDISATDAANSDVTQTTLTTQALKLATAIILIPGLDGCLGEDFQTLLLDRSIDVISRDNVSKTIANHHLYLLASQKFSSRIMTATKAEQLMASLVTIHNRVSGNSVISARLVIFSRLLEQAPTVMLSTIREWLTSVFHGSLSSIRDIRARAIDTGLMAGTALGTSYQATKAVLELFSTSSEGTTYGDFFTARLADMATNKDLAPHVPFIWSIVVLFFRSKKSKLSTWPLFKKAWLLIIQKCMNSGDSQVKYRAYLAWNRLIFVINPDKETKTSMDAFIQMLKIPIVSAFDKKDRDKQARETRQLAVSGYCHLLHYSLRPSLSYEELDIYWDEYVQPILSKLLRSTPKDVSLAARVLKALFNSTPKVWREDVANEMIAMSPEDLVRLDSHWIRSRLHRILHLLRPYISASLSAPGLDSSLDKTPWSDLLIAVAEAGSQEVRASVELREAMAHLMNFFGHVWKEADEHFAPQSTCTWITRFGTLICSAIDEIGALHFGEANLLRNEAENFEAAPTPSHRPSKHHTVLHPPVVCLFRLFAHPLVTVESNKDFFQVVKDVLHKICHARTSRIVRAHLLRQCSDAIRVEPPEGVKSATEAGLWALIAQECARTLLDPDMDQTAQEPQRLGNQVRDAVHILTIGFAHCTVDSPALSAWQELSTTAMNQLRQDAGEGAVVVGLTEPIAENLLKAMDTMTVPVVVQTVTTLLGKGAWPKNRQQMEDGRKALWTTSLTHTRHSIFEPFVHTLSLISMTLRQAYEALDQCKSYLPLLVTSVENFLEKSPGSQLHTSLRRMQEGLAVLVGDHDRLFIRSDNDLRNISTKVLSLWQTILRLLRALPSNATLLKALDSLLAASLNSSHRAIVNATVTFWNETFGKLDTLVYPPKVELALRRIRPLVELELPTFPDSVDDECASSLADFVDSQTLEEPVILAAPGKTKVGARERSPKFKVKTSAKFAVLRSTPTRTTRSSERHGSSTPRQATSRSMPKAKLRHEDSQVDFVAVPSSSPAPVEEESQLLTDRQKEVNMRQRYETAKLYPDFSSSPAPTSAKAKSRMPRLDFSAQKAVPEDYTTPTLDDQGPMDDYLESSPTPKAAEKDQSKFYTTTSAGPSEDLDMLNDLADSDIRSSPPQMSEDDDIECSETAEASVARRHQRQEDTVSKVLAEKAKMATGHDRNIVPLDEQAIAASTEDVHATQLGRNADATSVASKEAALVEQRLGRTAHDGAEFAREQTRSEVGITLSRSHAQGTDVYVDAPSEFETASENAAGDQRDQSSSPIDFTDSVGGLPSTNQHPATTADGVEAKSSSGNSHLNTSRVKDSFSGATSAIALDQLNPIKAASEIEPESQLSQQTSQRRSKRKRGEDTAGEAASDTPTKRRKQSSPLKRMLSWVTGSQQEEPAKGAEILECIVVASQPEPVILSTEAPAVSMSAPASIDVSKPKRGRGRPRKSETPTSSTPAETPRTRQLKRNSSVLSLASDVSLSADTPASKRARRITRSQDAGTIRSPAAVVEAPRSAKRTAEAVVIPISNFTWAEDLPEDTEDVTDEDANSQLRLEEEVAVQRNRVIAKPKSIMEKLKSILSDCKTLVLGSQEYRELDDVLFEVRREVHEAASRGREQ